MSISTSTDMNQGFSRLPSLTGLRFIAAGMVFFFHAAYEGLFSDSASQRGFMAIFGQGGWTGVGFFFILSGFVLTWSSRPSDTARRFWRRRICKIYPNHVVTFVVALVVLLGTAAVNVYDAFLNLFLLHAWSPELLTEVSVNPVAWSLSVEALFYFSFPLWIKLIRRIRPERLWPYAIAIMALVWLVPLLANLLPSEPKPFFAPISEWQFWFIYVLPPMRVLDFVLGMLLAQIVLKKRWINLGIVPALALVVVGYVLPSFLPWSFRLVACTIIPLALLIPAVAVADTTGQWSPFRSRVMVFLGDISFALYLWHRLVLSNGHRWLGGQSWSTPVALTVLLALFAVTVFLSWMLFRFIERPIMKRWSSPRPRPVPPTVSPPTSPITTH
jgi:peptidoglycan/LPS O-acetylase OafA/YrhL